MREFAYKVHVEVVLVQESLVKLLREDIESHEEDIEGAG